MNNYQTKKLLDRAFPSYIREYKDNGYIVLYATIMFHQFENKKTAPTSVEGEPDTISPHKMKVEMERFYHRYRGSLINNYCRPSKIPLSPHVVGFIDHPSSKKFSKCNRSGLSNKLETEKTLHVHSFYMLHPDTIKKYGGENKSEKQLVKAATDHFNRVKNKYNNTIESIHIRMTDNNIEKAVRYSSKAISQLPQSQDGDEYWFMLPKSKDEPRYQTENSASDHSSRINQDLITT